MEEPEIHIQRRVEHAIRDATLSLDRRSFITKLTSAAAAGLAWVIIGPNAGGVYATDLLKKRCFPPYGRYCSAQYCQDSGGCVAPYDICTNSDCPSVGCNYRDGFWYAGECGPQGTVKCYDCFTDGDCGTACGCKSTKRFTFC